MEHEPLFTQEEFELDFVTAIEMQLDHSLSFEEARVRAKNEIAASSTIPAGTKNRDENE